MAIALSAIVKESAKRANLSDEFAADFLDKIRKNEAVLKEYVHYLREGSFLGEYRVFGLSIADVLVYQIDHFKAWMDQDRLGMKFNPDEMVLKAFHSLLLMAEDPAMAQSFRNRMLSESGTDGTERETGCNY